MGAIPSPEIHARVWAEAELAWLQHLRAALGPQYRLMQFGSSLLLSSLDAVALRATFEFMSRTSQRIQKLLAGLAHVPERGHDILIIIDDDESYYRYVSHFYPDAGEFALSSGMHIGYGCGHFVTVKADLRAIEPVIAHEMTHGSLSHLPIPAWLNEGIAVNTEHRLASPLASIYTLREMHAKHLAFWGEAEMQAFWSGKSFLRSDDGNMLSYDLARILVSHFSSDWGRFQAFVLSADRADAGASSAIEHLGVRLGAAVAGMLEQDADDGWEPDAARWEPAPEPAAY